MTQTQQANGYRVEGGSRIALFAANALAAIFSFLLCFLLFIGAAMTGGTQTPSGLITFTFAVAFLLFLAGIAAMGVMWKLARHSRWDFKWQAAVGFAFLIVVGMQFLAPRGFWSGA